MKLIKDNLLKEGAIYEQHFEQHFNRKFLFIYYNNFLYNLQI